MLVARRQELVQAFEKPGRVLLPQQILQVHPQRVEAEGLRPAQLPVDGGEIKRVRLEHFQLVDGGAGQEIAADQPTVLFPPGLRPGLGPSARGGFGAPGAHRAK